MSREEEKVIVAPEGKQKKETNKKVAASDKYHEDLKEIHFNTIQQKYYFKSIKNKLKSIKKAEGDEEKKLLMDDVNIEVKRLDITVKRIENQIKFIDEKIKEKKYA